MVEATGKISKLKIIYLTKKLKIIKKLKKKSKE